MGLFLFISIFLIKTTAQSQNKEQPAFQVIPLGVKGGSDESNLSSYALAVKSSDQYVCVDAGTLNAVQGDQIGDLFTQSYLYLIE